ncbi:hypothetical protein [Phenylobacterium soli]|uniref:Uncharacterized protein n=1 Tax=Phenylobacterium soli TaxID=2170551 RepID=A0A328AK32_9CAUL|nr:hypothetical protein [Phenylobacterium soli]RAK54959.1 hypothetical protein DJ017_10670 [Phenylobacterium soli]
MKGLIKRFAWVWAVGLTAMSAPAWADPRLDEKVYDPYIENHTLEFETRWGQELGPGELKGARTFIVEGEYGLNDRVSLALLGQIERAPGEGDRLVGLGLEGVMYLGQIPKVDVDTGLYLEYKKGLHGENDEGEAKLLLAKTAGRFQGLFNFIVERPFGAPNGEGFASYGYATSLTWRTIGNLRLGAEAIGDFGDDHGFLSRAQGAYVGPQLKWEGKPQFLPVDVVVDAGWLKSVSAARQEADSQAKIIVEFERRF